MSARPTAKCTTPRSEGGGSPNTTKETIMLEQCFTDRDFHRLIQAEDPISIESDLRPEAWLTVDPVITHEDSIVLWDQARGNDDICRWLGDGFESNWQEPLPLSQSEGMEETSGHFDHDDPCDYAQHGKRHHRDGSVAWMDSEATLAWMSTEDDGPRTDRRSTPGAAQRAMELNDQARLEVLADLLLLADGTAAAEHVEQVLDHHAFHEMVEAVWTMQHTGPVIHRYAKDTTLDIPVGEREPTTRAQWKAKVEALRQRRESSPTAPRIPVQPKPREEKDLRIVDTGRAVKSIVRDGIETKALMGQMVAWANEAPRSPKQLMELRVRYQEEQQRVKDLRREWQLASERPTPVFAIAKSAVQLTARDIEDARKAEQGRRRRHVQDLYVQTAEHCLAWLTHEKQGVTLTEEAWTVRLQTLSLEELRQLYREIRDTPWVEYRAHHEADRMLQLIARIGASGQPRVIDSITVEQEDPEYADHHAGYPQVAVAA